MKNKDEFEQYEQLGYDILETLKSIKEQFYDTLKNVKDYDNQQSDLIHKLELEDLSYHEKAHIALELEKNRKERRKFKDINEILSGMNNLISNSNNEKAIIYFAKELIRTKHLKEGKANRTYIQRAKGDKKNDNIQQD